MGLVASFLLGVIVGAVTLAVVAVVSADARGGADGDEDD